MRTSTKTVERGILVPFVIIILVQILAQVLRGVLLYSVIFSWPVATKLVSVLHFYDGAVDADADADDDKKEEKECWW